MPTDQPEAKDSKGDRSGRLGGASADFVASLGRKIEGARDVLRTLEEEPTSARARDDLRRKLHALGAGARLLRFEAMARVVGEAEAVLERAARAGTVKKDETAFVAQALDDLPALAWGDLPTREPPRAETSDAPPAVQPAPFAALIVGDAGLAEGLHGDASSGRSFECERTDDVQAAVDLGRAFAPDLVVVDADLDGAEELVCALLDDPLTEPSPIVVVGTLSSERASRFVALGVAKLLPKPVPAETLRRACEEIIDQREGRTMRLTLGEPTLEQLGNRLADEVRRAIVESVDRPARGVRVPLGEGTEVLGAIWGAIARVQEVITAKTEGSVRFGAAAPEGAIALAPWLHHDLPGADRMRGRGRGAADDVRLDRRRVVVADDDPGVTWFIADLLRTAGCEVHEALDGETALEIAFKVSPELVVSDILMPGLDGFALCRALKRDVALRDTPVILLSWKEDLLQRVRELGASAAAYLKKESDSRAILARVREVLRGRARIEARLKGNDEVRGRLDGLTVRLLLELACALRPQGAKVAVRDASFLYEVDVRDGAPRRATQAAPDGSVIHGERVLARMLGASAGRFVVSPLRESVKADLHGTLAQQLGRPIAHARGALFATTGARTMNVELITLDPAGLDDYLRATPEPARAIVDRIADGASPRQMLLRGEIAPTLLEDVLADLAARGAITGVRAPGGQDLLTPAVDAAFAIFEGRVPPRRSTLPPPSRPALGARPVIPAAPRAPSDAIAREIAALTTSSAPPARSPAAVLANPEPPSAASALEHASEPPKYESFTLSEPAPPVPQPIESEAPSSLEDAVMRELSDRSTSHAPAGSPPPPIVEPSELRPRSSNPPSFSSLAAAQPPSPPEPMPAMPSIPPDAVVPATPLDEMAAAPLDADLAPEPPPAPIDGVRAIAELTEETEVDAPIEPKPRMELSMPLAPGARRELSMPVFVSAETVERAKKGVAPSIDEPHRTPLSSVKVAEPEALPPLPKKKSSGLGLVAGIALVGLVVGIGLRWSMPATNAPHPAAQPATTHAPVQPAAPATSAPPAAPALTAPADDPSFGELPAGTTVVDGQGWLALTAPNDALVRIDGAAQKTRGPKIGVALAQGFHDVRVGPPNREKVTLVEIRAGKATTIDMTK